MNVRFLDFRKNQGKFKISNNDGKLADVIPLFGHKTSRTRRILYQYNLSRILGRK